MKKKYLLVLTILIASCLVVPTVYSKKGGNPFNELWEAVNDLIFRVTGLEENYQDLLERVTILEGGGTVECSPGTADCDGSIANGCEHVYLDSVVGCEGGVQLNLLGDDEVTYVYSDNSEVTYNILLFEAAEPPGVPSIPSDLELLCTLTCTDSLYSLTLYDSDCNILYENTDQVSYIVIDEMGVPDSAELTLKIVYVSGCPCEPWTLTINTGHQW